MVIGTGMRRDRGTRMSRVLVWSSQVITGGLLGLGLGREYDSIGVNFPIGYGVE